MVNPWHITSRGQPVAKPETPLQNIQFEYSLKRLFPWLCCFIYSFSQTAVEVRMDGKKYLIEQWI